MVEKGQVFNRLTITEDLGLRPEKGGTKKRWVSASCVCGRNIEVRFECVRGGQTKSCGCYRKGLTSEAKTARVRLSRHPERVFWNRRYGQYKRSAGVRGHTFELSINEFRSLSCSPCTYCGTPPQVCTAAASSYAYAAERRGAGWDFVHFLSLLGNISGIDRVDNLVGYTITNCVACCFICNTAKNDMTERAWREWRENIAARLRDTPA